MTTIAYRDGIIACDSRATRDITILSDNANKMTEQDGCMFFYAGATCDEQKLIDAYFGKEVQSIEGNALVVDGGVIYLVGHDGKELWKCPTYEYGALGSGGDHALTAMDMGATAKEAVKIAMKRDACTGGTVRTYEVGNGPS